MNHKLFLTLSLLMSVMCQTINAQPDDRRPQISGQLLDADLKEPVVQATIQLFAVSDSTFAGGTVSDLAGTFSIEVPSHENTPSCLRYLYTDTPPVTSDYLLLPLNHFIVSIS